jgi:hypothetical protein
LRAHGRPLAIDYQLYRGGVLATLVPGRLRPNPPTMHAEIFALCDAATDQGGKLNLLGAFDTLYVSSVPAKHAACAIALRLRIEKSEEGEHAFKITIIDEDGNHAIPAIQGKLNIRVPPGFDTAAANLVVSFQGLELKQLGDHQVDFLIGNQVTASTPLHVRAHPPRGA